MAMFAQVDHNVVTGLLQVMSGATEFQALPPGRIMVPVHHAPEMGSTYDADTDTFTPAPVVPKTIVSKSQVISVLTPAEWAELGKYQPTAAAPYNDADVYWAVTQFQLADYIDLADPRYQAIMGGLVAKGLLTQARAAEMYSDLMALANG